MNTDYKEGDRVWVVLKNYLEKTTYVGPAVITRDLTDKTHGLDYDIRLDIPAYGSTNRTHSIYASEIKYAL